jgi:hypothetical protein
MMNYSPVKEWIYRVEILLYKTTVESSFHAHEVITQITVSGHNPERRCE